MRAVFTVDLPATHEHKYPDNLQIVQLLRSFGWEPMDVCALEDKTVKSQKYQKLGEPLFQHMPVTAVAKTDDMIFCGYLSDDYTRFVVIRLVNRHVYRSIDHGPGQLAGFAENLPGDLPQSDYCVVNGEAVPGTAETISDMAEPIAVTAETIPDTAEPIAVTTEPISIMIQTAPATAEVIAATTEPMPVTA